MGSEWRKVKLAFGLNLCVYSPRNHVADNNDDDDSLPLYVRRSDAVLLSPPGDWTSALPTPSSNRLKLSKSLSRSSSKKTCSICLATMRRKDGQAIFTAECSVENNASSFNKFLANWSRLSRAVSKSNRKEFVSKIQEMFGKLSGPVVFTKSLLLM